MPNAANGQAFSAGGRPGRMSPRRGRRTGHGSGRAWRRPRCRPGRRRAVRAPRMQESCAVSIRAIRALSAGFLGVAVGGGVGVGGRELGGQQGGASGSEHAGRRRTADDLFRRASAAWTVRVVGMVGGVLGAGPVVRAPVVGGQGGRACRRWCRSSAAGSPGTGPGTGRGRIAADDDSLLRSQYEIGAV